jgi:hypothetical protein
MTMIQTNITHILHEMTQDQTIKTVSLNWLISQQKLSRKPFYRQR